MKIKKLLKENIIVLDVLKEHFDEADAQILFSNYSMLTMSDPDPNIYNHKLAYASDIIRFVVLYIYGGVWFDMDVLFLRDLNSIKINRYTSQWGTDMCGNAAILRLEKGHSLIKEVVNRYRKPFYPTSTFQVDNDLSLTMLPSTFFDILWRGRDAIPKDINFIELEDFFKKGDKKITMENIFPSCYAYHWHNRWNDLIEENSPIDQLLNFFNLLKYQQQ